MRERPPIPSAYTAARQFQTGRDGHLMYEYKQTEAYGLRL